MRPLAIAVVIPLLLGDDDDANPPFPDVERCRVFPQDPMEHPRIVGIPSGGTRAQP